MNSWKKYIWVVTLFSILLLWIPMVQGGSSGKKTKLSSVAENLKSGMTRAQVVTLLGKPNWAVIPGDKGEWALPDPRIALELYWRNGKCPPVAVQFKDKGGQKVVSGWNAAIVGCFDVECPKSLLPGKEYSCKKKDRRRFCK